MWFERATLAKEYRADIDGLRAVAVMLVLTFHLGFDFLRGGFIGVDVFFVISGYLITRNIMTEYQSGTFTFNDFYFRRAKRILPALFFTICFSVVFGFLLLSPEHMARLGKAVMCATFSVSNILFKNESGYFDTASDSKPLLHTWSLGVEEQFYFVWPVLLLFLMARKKPALIFLVLLLLFVVFFALSEAALHKSQNAAFYLMPYRFFEFLIGALVVLASTYRLRNRIGNELVFAAGFALVIYAAFAFSEATAFPGTSALVPCLGAGLAIYSRKSAISARVLGNGMSVAVGRVSYSLYLIHWPLLVFYQYWKFQPLSIAERLGILAISVMLAFVMYKYVETPFRDRGQRRYPTPPKFWIRCAGVAVAASGASAMAQDGWKWRVPKATMGETSSPRAGNKHCRTERDFDGCVFGAHKLRPPEMILIGDSHAGHYLPAVNFLAKKAGLKGVYSMLPGCPPIFGAFKIYGSAKLANRQKKCQALVKQWETKLVKASYSYVILAGRWAWLTEPEQYGPYKIRRDWLVRDEKDPRTVMYSRSVFRKQIAYTIETLLRSGKKVILLGQVPEHGIDPHVCFQRPTYLLSNSSEQCVLIAPVLAIQRLDFSNQVLVAQEDLHQEKVVSFIPSDVMCGEHSCVHSYHGRIAYENDNHINENGSLYLAEHYMGHVAKFIQAR